jgi:hypothetical protein
MNSNANEAPLTATTLVAPISASSVDHIEHGLGWQSSSPGTAYCASKLVFPPECWRNFVTGAAFSLNNFDRAF